MLWRQMVCAAVVTASVWAPPCTAIGATMGSVTLGFGASYTAPDGTSCTHRGLDLSLSAGETVRAPVEGTVTFAGRVPGPHGGSVLALTLDTARGKVSLLPLAELGRQKGDQVAQGESLGSVAESGDPSSEGPHLHVGLRRSDLYIDPAVLLEAVAPAPEPEPEPEPEPQPRPQSAPQVAAPRAADGRTAPNTVPTASGVAPSPSPGVAPALAGAPAETVPNAVSMPTGVSLAPGAGAPTQAVSLRSSAQAAGWPQGAAPAAAGGMLPLIEKACEATLGWFRAAGALGFAGIAAAFAACAVLLGRRALEGRITSNMPVSDRLGRLLQQLRAGDTLRGLTSCPGPLPSQSRGRLAQRR